MFIFGLIGIIVVIVWAIINPSAFVESSQWWIFGGITIALWLSFRLFDSINLYNSRYGQTPALPTILSGISWLGVIAVIIVTFILISWQAGLAIILSQPLWITISSFISRAVSKSLS